MSSISLTNSIVGTLYRCKTFALRKPVDHQSCLIMKNDFCAMKNTVTGLTKYDEFRPIAMRQAAKMTQKLPNLRSSSEKSSGNLVSLLFHVFFQSSRLHLVSILFYASTSLTSESSSLFHVFRYP